MYTQKTYVIPHSYKFILGKELVAKGHGCIQEVYPMMNFSILLQKYQYILHKLFCMLPLAYMSHVEGDKDSRWSQYNKTHTYNFTQVCDWSIQIYIYIYIYIYIFIYIYVKHYNRFSLMSDISISELPK